MQQARLKISKEGPQHYLEVMHAGASIKFPVTKEDLTSISNEYRRNEIDFGIIDVELKVNGRNIYVKTIRQEQSEFGLDTTEIKRGTTLT